MVSAAHFVLVFINSAIMHIHKVIRSLAHVKLARLFLLLFSLPKEFGKAIGVSIHFLREFPLLFPINSPRASSNPLTVPTGQLRASSVCPSLLLLFLPTGRWPTHLHKQRPPVITVSLSSVHPLPP